MKLIKRLVFVICLSLPYLVFAQTSSEYYEKALEAFAKNDYGASYIFLKNSLQQNENNLPAKILMGKTLMINTYMDPAEVILEEALMLGGDPSLIVDTLGKIWLYTEQNEKIIDSKFSNLTNQAQTDWYVILASAHSNLKEPDNARIVYKKALQIDPNKISALNSLALLEMHLDDFETSNKYLKKSILLESENIATLRLLGDLQLRRGNIKDAINLYKKSYDLEPLDPFTKRALVTAYIQNQDIGSARSLLVEILKQTPGDPSALLLQAWIMAKDQFNKEAAIQLEMLSARLAGLTGETLQKRPALLYISALSAYTLQNDQQAISFFNQYLSLVPDNIEAVTLLAQTHIRQNDKKRALKLLQLHESKLVNKVDTAIILAELYLNERKSFSAIEINKKLLELYPDNENVKLLEIEILIFRGKQHEALSKLKSSGFSDTNIKFLITKAQLLIEMGNLDEANNIADKFLVLEPENIEFINFKAVIFMRQKNFKEARAYLNKAQIINPEHLTTRFNLATVLSFLGEYEQAIEVLEQLDKTQPDTIKVLTLLAQVQFSMGDIEAASGRLERVLEKDSDNLTAMELLANIYFRKEEPQRAIRQLSKAIRIQPDNIQYQMQRVELYLYLNQSERVTEELSKIKQLVQDDPKGLVDLSNMQLKVKDFQGAKQSIVRALQLKPEQLNIAIGYIRIHLITGALENAQKELSKWLTVQPNLPQLLVLSGDFYNANGEPKAASIAYLKALDAAANYRPALAKLYQLTNKGIAQDAFESKVLTLINTDPEDYFSRNLLADFYNSRSDFKNALIHYEKLIEIEQLPNKALILNNISNIYIDIDLTKAKQFIQQALEEGLEIAALYDTHGWILSLMGQYDDALNALRKSFAMSSDDPANQYHLAYTLYKLGRISPAKTSLEHALSSTLPFTERTEAQALLLKL